MLREFLPQGGMRSASPRVASTVDRIERSDSNNLMETLMEGKMILRDTMKEGTFQTQTHTKNLRENRDPILELFWKNCSTVDNGVL